MKRRFQEFTGLVPLEYVRFINVPVKKTKSGDVIALPPHVLEELAAKAVIKERIPLRGREVRFLRKTLGLSLEKFAAKLGLSAGTVLHWERAEDSQLSSMNEAGVRAFVAEELGVELEGKLSALIGGKIHEIKIHADAS
jgi:DNA-binding transcriptional regulator YiaG